MLAIAATTLLDKKLLELFYSEYGILFNLTSSLILSLNQKGLILPNWNMFSESGQLSKELAKLILTLNLSLVTVWLVDVLRNIKLFSQYNSNLLNNFFQSIFNILISIWVVALSEIIIIFSDLRLIPQSNLSHKDFYEISLIALILLRLILEMIRERMHNTIGYQQTKRISELSDTPMWFVAMTLPLVKTFLSIIFATLGMIVKLATVVLLYNLVQTFDLMSLFYIFILYLLTLILDKMQQSLYATLI